METAESFSDCNATKVERLELSGHEVKFAQKALFKEHETVSPLRFPQATTVLFCTSRGLVAAGARRRGVVVVAVLPSREATPSDIKGLTARGCFRNSNWCSVRRDVVSCYPVQGTGSQPPVNNLFHGMARTSRTNDLQNSLQLFLL